MLILLSLIAAGVALTAATIGDDDDDNSQAVEEVETTMPPGEVTDGTDMVMPDTGASVVTSEDGTSVSVELGDDETGSLVLFNYYDTEDEGISLGEYFEQRLYLLPEGQTLPDIDATNFSGGLDDFETENGLELLGTWSLGAIEPTLDERGNVEFLDNRTDGPTITANAPITAYDVETNTDGDDLIYLEPSDPDWLADVFYKTLRGQERIQIEDEDGNITIEVVENGDTVTAGDGDDLITLDSDRDRTTIAIPSVTIEAGAGDDIIAMPELFPEGVTFDAGEGDDIIVLRQSHGTVTLGDGADIMAFNSELRDSLEFALITDFNPAEDRIVLAVDGPFEVQGRPGTPGSPFDEGDEDRVLDIINLTITQDPESDETRVELMTLLGGAEFGAGLRFSGMPDITEDMITLVNSYSDVPELAPALEVSA